MTASEAREQIKTQFKNKETTELGKIYKQINEAIEFGWYSVFISTFDISNEHKTILENDGYFVDTRYTRGFDIRWMETNMEYFLSIVKSNKECGKLKIDESVIENYILNAFI
jgi:hypothetical protein